ncbi:MAG: aminoglycoside phosphotransferase family protein [Verrucomicrobiaceae bacterium]|nr:MAG: aminoglycoside phosphotransferase family protein [Verrucomicrobiaceae bacterium]
MLAVRSENLKRTLSAPERNEPVSGSVCEMVLKRFRGMDECPADWPDDWKPLGEPLVRRESTIHRLVSERGSRSICVKIINKPSRKPKDSSRLYAALSHYHSRSDREKGYTVPQPYGCIPELGVVIMEWVDGITFSEILKKQQFSNRKRHQEIQKVAGWLRWFHSRSELGSETVAESGQLESIIKVFKERRGLDKAAVSHDAVLGRQLKKALKHAGVLRGVEMDTAILHGDFKPTNLLFCESGAVVGIDFQGTRRGPVTQDICRFLIDLDFYRNLVRRSYALSPGSGTNDFEVFLSAYGGKAAGISRPAFVHLYFLAILSALVHQRKKFRPGARHRVRLAVFRSIARQLSQEISPEAAPAAVVPQSLSWLFHPRMPAFSLSSLQFPLEWAVVLLDSELIGTLMSI